MSAAGALIVRGQPRRTFTVLEDDDFVPGMSARAWGVYAFLKSRPPGWQARTDHLCKQFKEGRDALYTTLNELVDLGLMVKLSYLDSGLIRWRYGLASDVAEQGEDDGQPGPPEPQTRRSAPETDFQEPDSPDAGFPDPENPTGVSKEVTTTETTTPAPPEPPPPTGRGGAATGQVRALVVVVRAALPEHLAAGVAGGPLTRACERLVELGWSDEPLGRVVREHDWRGARCPAVIAWLDGLDRPRALSKPVGPSRTRCTLHPQHLALGCPECARGATQRGAASLRAGYRATQAGRSAGVTA